MKDDTSGIVLRMLTSGEDAAAAHDFFMNMLTEQFSSTFSETALTAYRNKYNPGMFRQRVSTEESVLAAGFDGSSIIALIIGGTPNGGVASLDWVVVAPDYQGQGIGRRLVCACLEAYRTTGAHKVVLYSETEQGRRFYEKCGMSCEGIHPHHWWGLTHYCMAYVFDDPNKSGNGGNLS